MKEIEKKRKEKKRKGGEPVHHIFKDLGLGGKKLYVIINHFFLDL